ncbi:LLM class flavin-dependent oxidoreductase [Streptomyces sp. NPDC096057]|uniref:LLM class flavin-dependent oxidoreductase n=1 Tax=Streptomyces sp. NPDC096057 TaxID=3155543 RepID=UPI0033294057
MKIGIGLPHRIRDVRPDTVPAWGRVSEEAGCSSLGALGRIPYAGVMGGLTSGPLPASVRRPVLSAKEGAGIDAVSGGRRARGLEWGGRADDSVVDGLGPWGTTKRLGQSTETDRSVRRGEVPPGCENQAVPAGTREPPPLFCGTAQASFDGVARSGRGYVAPSAPPVAVGPAFDRVRTAWRTAGREGTPYPVALANFAPGDEHRGGAAVHDSCRPTGSEGTRARAAEMRARIAGVRATADAVEELGVDELMFNPTVDDLDHVARPADAVR